jgi:hypothetical protein
MIGRRENAILSQGRFSDAVLHGESFPLGLLQYQSVVFCC